MLRVVLTQIFTELSTDFHGFYCGSVDRQVTVSLTEALRRLSAMIITNKPRGVGAAGLIWYYLSQLSFRVVRGAIIVTWQAWLG